MADINILRVETKLQEMFSDKIDVSDLQNKKSEEEIRKIFLSRSLAALAIMMECGIDTDIAVKCVTDGYNDMGIDAAYCDEKQKKLVLVQSKWRSNGGGAISQDESLVFVEGVKRVIGLEFEGVNLKLQQKVPEMTQAIKDMDYTVHMSFCHTGSVSISEYVKRPINELIKNTNEDASEILRFDELKMSDIFSYLSSGQGNDSIDIDDVILNNWGFVEGTYKAYYGVVSAAALGDWYSRFGNKLFDRNIRFYKGNTDVNDGIRKVLNDEPENFIYYNNGIKMLCKKAIRKSAYSTDRQTGLFRLEGVSLVNGAQTTGTIGKFFRENSAQTDKAKVMLQIIELGENNDKNAVQITKLSNTQNRIENKDFAALDPQQERLKNEMMFSNVLYLFKTGAVVNDPEKQVTIDEAIIVQACIQDDVSYTVTAKKNIGALTEDMSKAPYKVLFNANTNSYSIINGIRIMRRVDKYLQVKESELEGRNRLAIIHGNRLLLHLILNELKVLDGYETRTLDINVLRDIIEQRCGCFIQLAIDAMNMIYPDAYPANIFKNVGRCRELIKKIREESPENE